MSDIIPGAFPFAVSFSGDERDSAFQDVSGLTSTIEIENFTEGGENHFSHKLPKGVSRPHLVLKRGVVQKDSPFVSWCIEVQENSFSLAEPIKPKVVVIKLFNHKGSPVRSWTLTNCWPVKWEIDAFNSTKHTLAIAAIELACHSIESHAQLYDDRGDKADVVTPYRCTSAVGTMRELPSERLYYGENEWQFGLLEGCSERSGE